MPLPTEFIVPLAAADQTWAERIGPKAANLAALARAGLPTPGGFCLDANAYRAQMAALGLHELVLRFAAGDVVEQRRLAVDIDLPSMSSRSRKPSAFRCSQRRMRCAKKPARPRPCAPRR